MFVRNLLQAGDNVTIIPAGIRITLQYGEKGQVESVYTGYEDDKVLHEELLLPLLTSKEIPSKVPVKNGTTFVYGVLYSGDIYKTEGYLQSEVESFCINKYLEDNSKFHFFAGHMHSLALSLNSPVTIQRWLKTSGFKTLMSYLAPSSIREDNFSSMINFSTYPFEFPRILGYVVYRSNQHSFMYTNLRQVIIKDIKKFVSDEGFIQAEIKSYDLGSIEVPYSDVVNFNLHKDTMLLINDDDQIVYTSNLTVKKLKELGRTITCEFCGKIIEVPTQSRKFTCTNEHCASVMYSRACKLLQSLNLPVPELSKFRKFSEGFNSVVSLPDVLDMEDYQDTIVEIDLPNLLQASVPSTIVTRLEDWVAFCNCCNNSKESVVYYLQNPGRITKDFKLSPAIYRRLVSWLEDSDNQLDIVGLMNHPNISVIASGKRLEGAPIFRGKSIYITGKFQHGSNKDIIAILTSYSAQVYETFNTAVDCVIVGDLHEGVSGKDIQRARSMQIPVFEESEFFDKYEIDEDLTANFQS